MSKKIMITYKFNIYTKINSTGNTNNNQKTKMFILIVKIIHLIK
jgi:hypothetical protein